MTTTRPHSAGRYAPSPSGRLHIGNLRTALIAYGLAVRSGRRFVMRVEDIDRVKEGAAADQLADLAALGITWQHPELYQSTRAEAHEQALAELTQRSLTYECYCSRKDILAAPTAPHTPPGSYPGTCRDLSQTERERARERLAAAGRSPSIRLRTDTRSFTVTEQIVGVSPTAPEEATTSYTGVVDDFVMRRGDGVLAYNLVAVLDDAYQGVDQVCRGDDLFASAPRQAYLAAILGVTEPVYAHVPLVVNEEGARLAKRDGSVTLPQLIEAGWTTGDVIEWCATSLALPRVRSSEDFVAECSLSALRAACGPHVFAPPTP